MTLDDITVFLNLGFFCRVKSQPDYYYFIYDGKNYEWQTGLQPENGKPSIGKAYKISAKPIIINGFNGYSLEEWKPSFSDFKSVDWEVPQMDILEEDAASVEEQTTKEFKPLDVRTPIKKRPPRIVEEPSEIDFDTALIHMRNQGLVEVPIYEESETLAKQFYLFDLSVLMTRDRLYDKKYTSWVGYTWQAGDYLCTDYRLLKAKDKNDS